MRVPALTLIVGVLVFGGLAVAVFGYSAAGFGGTTQPAARQRLRQGHSAADQVLSRSRRPTRPRRSSGSASPSGPSPQVLAKATAEMKASSLFTQVSGPLNPASTMLPPATYAALRCRLRPGQGPAADPAARQQSAAGGVPGLPLHRELHQRGRADRAVLRGTQGRRSGQHRGPERRAPPSARKITRVAATVGVCAADSAVGGEAPALYDISNVSNHDLTRIIPIAIVVIGILLALVLRSLVAPLYLIASVGLSFLAALGLCVLLFIKLGGDKGIVFFLPFLMFIFLLALGEDYNILVMTRIREEAHRLPLREAVTKAIGVTGTTVTSAGLVLAGTFVVFGVVIAHKSMGGSQFRDIAVRPGARHPDGHLPGPHAAGAVDGRAARPVELVAYPGHHGPPPAGRAGGRAGRAGDGRAHGAPGTVLSGGLTARGPWACSTRPGARPAAWLRTAVCTAWVCGTRA